MPAAASHDWVAAGVPGLLSIVVPAHNEADCLPDVLPPLVKALQDAGIAHEILVVNDGSHRRHRRGAGRTGHASPHVRFIDNPRPTASAWRCAPGSRNSAATRLPS